MASNPKICKYLDIPIQHISNNILKLMGRRGRKELIVDTINKLRYNIKDICLRTSLIVGFPGETEEDFNELKNFVIETRFDNLGVFKYSQEEDTPAAIMKNQLDEEVKDKRYNELMSLQQNISKEINAKKIGRVYDVLVEGYENFKWFGRNYEMCPVIDGIIYFESKNDLKIGSIIQVKIVDSLEYDLLGVVSYESC